MRVAQIIKRRANRLEKRMQGIRCLNDGLADVPAVDPASRDLIKKCTTS